MSDIVDVNGTRLRVQWDGPEDGPVVMLSNSLASRLEMWDPQIPALTGAGYSVLRYDSRGMGLSEVPPGPYSIELLTTDAVGLMDVMGLEKVRFCGLSKGGMVGQMLATVHPHRLHCAVLCDTAAQLGPPEVWDGRVRMAREQGMDAIVQPTLERWFTEAGRKRQPDDVASVGEMISTTPLEGYVNCCHAIKVMDQREAIKSVDIPVLVIVGEEDTGTPVSAAELIHANISGSELVILKEAAHFANMEQAEAFNAALMPFLAAHG